MRALIRLVLRDTRAGSAAEFALVLPLLLIFLIGIIDVGRFIWTCNEAEKATQMGVRYAVVTDPVPSGLAGYDFVGTSGLTQGDVVPTSAYGTQTCYKSGTVKCDLCSSTCPWGSAVNTTAFSNIYNRMRLFLPQLTDSNMQILYKPSGLGFAGDPNGQDASPIVTVQLTGVTFTPMLARLFGGQITLPSFSAALTMEDGQGTVAN